MLHRRSCSQNWYTLNAVISSGFKYFLCRILWYSGVPPGSASLCWRRNANFLLVTHVLHPSQIFLPSVISISDSFILKISARFFVCLFFFFRSLHAVLRGFSWLCTQTLLRNQVQGYWIPEITLGSDMYKRNNSTHSTVKYVF